MDYLFGVVSGLILAWLAELFLFRSKYAQEADSLRADLQTAQRRGKDLERNLAAKEAEVEDIRGRLAHSQTNTETLEAELTTLADLRAQVEQGTAKASDLEMKVSTLEKNVSALSAEKDTLNSENSSLNTKLEACNASLQSAQTEIEELSTKLAHEVAEDREEETEAAIAAGEVVVESAEPDDLKRIEGIGPKYAQVLNDAGITTFVQLARASNEQLSNIMKESGVRGVPVVDTWAEQAGLAAAGKWGELEALQDILEGGRRPK